MTVKILRGDNRNTLKTLEDKSIHTVVTSPPYWGLRDYGTATWEGGDPDCDHVANPQATKKMGNEEFNKNRPSREETKTKGYYENICPKCGARRIDNQLGLEETPEKYVNNLVDVFREIKRVLRDDGTVWLNLGDSYLSQPAGNKKPSGFSQTRPSRIKNGVGTETVALPKKRQIAGLKTKDLVGMPWRVAFALQQDGWYLRQDIIWHKPNPMPESVKDRCTKAHEYIFLLSKNVKYYYDHEAIKEPITDSTAKRLLQKNIDNQKGSERAHAGEKPNGNMKALGRKKFDSSMGGGGTSFVGHSGYKKSDGSYMISPTRNKRSVWTVTTKPFKEAHFATFPMDLIEPCILAGCPEAGTVLDPFGGAGTTGIVASNHNRNAILCELNDEYSDIAEKRIESNLPLFAGKN